MVDLDHCSYATIWAGDKDCYRGNIRYLSIARSFFLFTSRPLIFHWSPLSFSPPPFVSFQLFSVSSSLPGPRRSSPCHVLHLSQQCSLSHTTHSPPPKPPVRFSSSPSIPLSSVHWIWCCVIVSASLLGWRLSKGPQDPRALRELQPCQRCPSLLSSPLLSSPLLSSPLLSSPLFSSPLLSSPLLSSLLLSSPLLSSPLLSHPLLPSHLIFLSSHHLSDLSSSPQDRRKGQIWSFLLLFWFSGIKASH